MITIVVVDNRRCVLILFFDIHFFAFIRIEVNQKTKHKIDKHYITFRKRLDTRRQLMLN